MTMKQYDKTSKSKLLKKVRRQVEVEIIYITQKLIN